MVAKDCDKVLEALVHLLPTLEKLVTKKASDKTMLQIIEGIDALNSQNEDLQEWAGRLGFVTTSVKSAAKKKRRKTDSEAHDWSGRKIDSDVHAW